MPKLLTYFTVSDTVNEVKWMPCWRLNVNFVPYVGGDPYVMRVEQFYWFYRISPKNGFLYEGLVVWIAYGHTSSVLLSLGLSLPDILTLRNYRPVCQIIERAWYYRSLILLFVCVIDFYQQLVGCGLNLTTTEGSRVEWFVQTNVSPTTTHQRQHQFLGTSIQTHLEMCDRLNRVRLQRPDLLYASKSAQTFLRFRNIHFDFFALASRGKMLSFVLRQCCRMWLRFGLSKPEIYIQVYSCSLQVNGSQPSQIKSEFELDQKTSRWKSFLLIGCTRNYCVEIKVHSELMYFLEDRFTLCTSPCFWSSL